MLSESENNETQKQSRPPAGLAPLEEASMPTASYFIGPASNGMPSSIRYEGPPPSSTGRITAEDLVPPSSNARRLLFIAVPAATCLGFALGYYVAPGDQESEAERAAVSPELASQSEPVEQAVSEPAVTEPAVAEPAVAEPAVAEPTRVEEKAPAGPEKTEPAAASAAVCRASLESSPLGAAIFHQGGLIGETPYDGDIPCELGDVLLVHPQYRPARVSLERNEAELATASAILERPLYTVKINTIPRKATIKMDGKFVGRSPVVMELPGFEPSSISVARVGFVAQTFEIRPTEETSVQELQLEPYVPPE